MMIALRALCSLRLAWLLLFGTCALRSAAANDTQADALRLIVEALRTAGDARIGAGSPAARASIASLYEQRSFTPL